MQSPYSIADLELSDLGLQCFHLCGTDGDQNENQLCLISLNRAQHWEGRSLLTGWIGTNNDSGTIGLKESVTQEAGTD